MRKNIYLIGLNSFEIRIVSQALCRTYGACVIHLSITIMMVLLRSTKYLNMKEQSKRIPPQKASARLYHDTTKQ